MDSMFAMRTRCVNVELAIPEMAVVTIVSVHGCFCKERVFKGTHAQLYGIIIIYM